MTIRLSDHEAAVLLGATLMHWGVPFHHAAKRPLTEEQQSMIDGASDKLIKVREDYRRVEVDAIQEVIISDEEMALLIAVVEDCLNECGSDAVELSLQLNTRERSEVERLLERLRASLESQYAGLEQ